MKTSICVFVSVLACTYAIGLQVKTTEGIVEGYKADDGNYYKFYGIPYAGRVDGINRFKAPKPPTRYGGIFYAKDDSIKCAQPSKNSIIGVENCLVLNIFTKNLTTSKPVVVWIDAEDYTTTTNHITPFKKFVENDLVFVSLNFRLSIFGFLCLGVQEAPGNAGLRDVIQGLKWIKSNIVNFGGDPNNIVLMGHASGAAIVDLITMVPQAKGLVNKTITLNGSGLAPWAVAYDPVGHAQLLGNTLGYTNKSKEDLAKYLMSINNIFLNSALTEFSTFKNNIPLFAPCVENINLNSNDTFLTDAPFNLLLSGNYLQIPYIAGFILREGIIRISEVDYDDWPLYDLDNHLIDSLPVDIDINNRTTADDVLLTIKAWYFDDETYENRKKVFVQYEYDYNVVWPVIRGAKKRSLTSNAEVRLFEFEFLGSNNKSNLYNSSLNAHGGMLDYIFEYDLKPFNKSMPSMVQQIASFAYTGLQNETNASTPWSWLPITKDKLHTLEYMFLDNKYAEILDDEPRMLKLHMWDEIYDQYYKPPRAVNYFHKVVNSTKHGGNSVGVNRNSLYTFFISAMLIFLINC